MLQYFTLSLIIVLQVCSSFKYNAMQIAQMKDLQTKNQTFIQFTMGPFCQILNSLAYANEMV